MCSKGPRSVSGRELEANIWDTMYGNLAVAVEYRWIAVRARETQWNRYL